MNTSNYIWMQWGKSKVHSEDLISITGIIKLRNSLEERLEQTEFVSWEDWSLRKQRRPVWNQKGKEVLSNEEYHLSVFFSYAPTYL